MFDPAAVQRVITDALRRKMEGYNPESSHMPFHTRLLGKDRMALFSFIHSLNTNFGTAIFEQVALEIASGRFEGAERQRVVGLEISTEAQEAITGIVNRLADGSGEPNDLAEVEEIRRCAQSGGVVAKKMRNADLFLANEGEVVLVELKTAKPNVDGFEKVKQNLLEWVAATLHKNPQTDVRVVVAIPYNPYEPQPYKRWTLKGMLDIGNQRQLMVGNEFWDFLAGEAIYDRLLDCFEQVGVEMREEIDDYFKRFLSK